MKRDLLTFLVLELLVMAVAVLSFRFVDDWFVAALVAGASFVSLGAWLVLRTLRWPQRFRYLTFYFARVHMWLFALPMLMVRIRYVGHEWKDIHLLGIPGPTLHHYSELAYALLLAATIVDLTRVWRDSGAIKKAA